MGQCKFCIAKEGVTQEDVSDPGERKKKNKRKGKYTWEEGRGKSRAVKRTLVCSYARISENEKQTQQERSEGL